ncbi:MAG: hypothetical protein SGILL_008919 [Bacillariaceae sp.]
MHSSVLGCMAMGGSNLFGASSDDSDDSDGGSIDISLDDSRNSEDDEYGSQDSPEKSSPSSPFLSKMKGRSSQYSGDASVNSRASSITAISDMFLVAATSTGDDDGEGIVRDERVSSHSRTSKRRNTVEQRQGRIIQILLLALLLCGGYIIKGLIVHSIEASTDDLSSSLEPMHHGIRTVDSDSQNHAAQEPDDEVYEMYEEQVNELHSQVVSLQNTVHQLAEQQLAGEYFEGLVTSSKDVIEVKVDLGDVLTGHSFVIQASHSQLPYSTLVFLREVSNGDWILRSKDQWLEIVAANSQGSEKRYVRQSLSPTDIAQQQGSLDLLERSINVDRPFVVGIRNPDKGDVGVVISIYKERGMCGHYQHEVCFGTVSEAGRSTLLAVTEVQKPIPITEISTRS